MTEANKVFYRRVRRTHVFIALLAALTVSAEAQSPSLTLSGASGAPGSPVTLNVNLNLGAGSPPSSIQWDLTYSPSDLGLVAGTYDSTGAAAGAAGKSAACNSISAGDVRCVVSGIDTSTFGNGVLASLTFEIAPGTTDTATTVSLVSPDAADGSANALAVTGGGATVSINHQTAPAAVSVSPSPGSGTSQTFAFVFSDAAGAADIKATQVGINSVMSGTDACWTYYAAATQMLYLVNDAGVFQNAGLVLGSAGTLQNSQCTINVNASSASMSGDTLTLNLALTFAPSFAGAKNIYMYVKNASATSGFVQEGTWTVPAVTGPTPGAAPVSVTPSSGSGSSETFAFAFSDLAGATDITGVQIGINTAVSGSHACWMYYGTATQMLYLADDAGAFSNGGLVLGSSGTLQNSQCAVDVNASSVSMSGDTLSLNLALNFPPAFAGTKNVYMYAKNATAASNFIQEGTWTVPNATGPTIAPVPDSVTPNSGSGFSQTFAFAFYDSAGATDITSAQIGFNTVVSGSGACWMYYAAATQMLYLVNNVGIFQNAGLAVGSSGTLRNRQCTVNLSASSVSMSGNTLTLNLALSFGSGFAGTQNIYMYVENTTASGFFQEGTWTVP